MVPPFSGGGGGGERDPCSGGSCDRVHQRGGACPGGSHIYFFLHIINLWHSNSTQSICATVFFCGAAPHNGLCVGNTGAINQIVIRETPHRTEHCGVRLQYNSARWFPWMFNTFKENAANYSTWSLVGTHLPPRVHKSPFSGPLAANQLKLSLLPVMVQGIMTINWGRYIN